MTKPTLPKSGGSFVRETETGGIAKAGVDAPTSDPKPKTTAPAKPKEAKSK